MHLSIRDIPRAATTLPPSPDQGMDVSRESGLRLPVPDHCGRLGVNSLDRSFLDGCCLRRTFLELGRAREVVPASMLFFTARTTFSGLHGADSEGSSTRGTYDYEHEVQVPVGVELAARHSVHFLVRGEASATNKQNSTGAAAAKIR